MDLEVDHIIPLAVSNDDSDENQQALCRDCHALKTAAECSAGVSNMPEWLPKPLIPVVAVCGPPGSGKSTYVRNNAWPNDLVLDADEIAAKLNGKPIYHADQSDMDAAIRYRNTMLARLGRARDSAAHPRCWLIVTASTPKAMSFWRRYATKLIVLNPGPTECARRINADARRPEQAKRRALQAVRQWGQAADAYEQSKRTQARKVRIGLDGYPVMVGGE